MGWKQGYRRVDNEHNGDDEVAKRILKEEDIGAREG